MQSLAVRQAVFTLGMVVCVILEALLAGSLFGLRGVEGVVYAAALCVIPGWLTIFAGELARHRDLSAYVVLVGTGLRMMFVLIGFFVVSALRPDLGFRAFTIWLVPSYLAALALETWMVLITNSPEVAR